MNCPREYVPSSPPSPPPPPPEDTCDPEKFVQAWDYEILAAESGTDRYGVVDVLSLESHHPDLSMQFFSPDTNELASYTVKLTKYASEPGQWVCFGYIDPAFENELRENPDDPIYTETLSVCTDGTTYNIYDNSADCTGFVMDVEGA